MIDCPCRALFGIAQIIAFDRARLSPRNYDWKADGVLGTLTINGPGVERMPKKRKIPPRQDGIAGR
jgi:hypothetical protein